MGCTRLEALFAALLFTAGLMLTTDYVGMDDPQLLGHAVAMGGLLLALREPRTPRLMVASALVFVLAFFVKHNLVVLPAALALWLLLADRRHAVTFIASGLVFLLIGLGLFKQAFGFSLLSQIDSARVLCAGRISGAASRNGCPGAPVPLCGAALLFAIARHDRHAMFCVIYAVFAVVAGAYLLGGAGVDSNALFDADIALALCAGAADEPAAISARGGCAAALALSPYRSPSACCALVDAAGATPISGCIQWPQERGVAAGEIALIRAADGPVLCEMLSLCYWAGKPAEADVFNLEQAYLTGARSDADLVHARSKRSTSP